MIIDGDGGNKGGESLKQGDSCGGSVMCTSVLEYTNQLVVDEVEVSHA
jgi:hypothetical protein